VIEDKDLMDSISLISLFFAMIIYVAIPGPGVFATVARSLSSGFRSALAVVIGIAAGDIVYLTFAIFSLSIIAQSMGKLFFIVKICGGAYLVWLGLKMWFAKPTETDSKQLHESSQLGNVTSGLLISLSNPKVILFYCGFLPTFIDLTELRPIDVTGVFCVVIVALFSVLTAYSYLASHVRQLFSSRTAMKNLNRSAGGVMMATGVAIASKS